MDNSVIINKNNFKKSADTILFDIPSAENKEQGFLVWFDGEFKAYLNQCRHMDVCLDWQPNNFLMRIKNLLFAQLMEQFTCHPQANVSLDRVKEKV